MGIGELGVPRHDAAPVGIRATVFAQVTYLAQSTPILTRTAPLGAREGEPYSKPLWASERGLGRDLPTCVYTVAG